MAANQHSTIKPVRATIALGGYDLNVFMLQDGTYRLSQSEIAQAVEKDEITFRRWVKAEQAKPLQEKTFNIDIMKVAVEGSKGKANLITIDVAVGYWTKEAVSGNVKSALLLGACAAESIERRADKQFNIERTEQERNERLKARAEGKVARRTLTDSIKDYLDNHSELSENYSHWIYSNVSDTLNVAIFGKKAAQLVVERGCARNKLRDTHSAEDLNRIEHHERYAMRMIDKFDCEPLKAMQEAIEFYS